MPGKIICFLHKEGPIRVLLNLRKFRKSVDGKAVSDYNGVRICESVANLHDGFCFRKRGGRRAGGAAIDFADAVCCQIMAERIACPQAMRERNLFLSGHMSSLLSIVKEFLL